MPSCHVVIHNINAFYSWCYSFFTSVYDFVWISSHFLLFLLFHHCACRCWVLCVFVQCATATRMFSFIYNNLQRTRKTIESTMHTHTLFGLLHTMCLDTVWVSDFFSSSSCITLLVCSFFFIVVVIMFISVVFYDAPL